MTERDEKRFFQDAVDHRLSGMNENPFLAQRIIAAEKGDKPKVKKKLSASLIFAIVLMVLTLSVGYALVQSRIADHLYPGEEAPQAVIDHIQTPNAVTVSDVASVSIDELLYDGSTLYTSFTVTNPTSETLLYTIDGVWLNDVPLSRSTLTMEGAGSYGRLLGGTVEGTALPASASLYNEGQLYAYSEEGRFLGFEAVPEGEATLRISVAVWEPLNAPRLVDYADFEGSGASETADCLVTDARGHADLELFRPEASYRNTTALQRSSEVYAPVYEALGWAKLLETVEVETTVTLSRDDLTHAVPVQTEYQLGDGLTLTITGFEMSQTGGYVDGYLTGDDAAVKDWLYNGLCLVDRATDRVFNNGVTWSSREEGADGVAFRMELWPVTGELPDYVELAPVVRYSPVWEVGTPDYDPDAEKPESVIGPFELDFSRGIRIEFK